MIFKRFQSKWSIIEKASYQVAVSDYAPYSYVSDIAKDMIAFIEHQLREFQPHDDYKELLKMTIIFLNDLELLKNIDKFKSVNTDISQIVLKKSLWASVALVGTYCSCFF